MPRAGRYAPGNWRTANNVGITTIRTRRARRMTRAAAVDCRPRSATSLTG